WLGVVGEIFSNAGQSTFWWLIRSRGYGASEVGVFNLSWSWAVALWAAGSWGRLIGLGRLSGSLAGGRTGVLAPAALWLPAASLVLQMAWQVVWPSLVQRWGHESLQLALTVFTLVKIALYLAGSGLWLASLVALARATPDGARASWRWRTAAAAVAILAE